MEYDMLQFERDFIKRTSSILTNYADDYDTTLLLNCMLGLLIVPRERLLRFLPSTPMSLEAWGIPSTAIICVERGKGTEIGDRSICWFVIKLRNAVAHFQFLPIHEKGSISGFEFWDRSGFRILLTLKAIRHFLQALSRQLETGPDTRPVAVTRVGDEAKWSKNAKLFSHTPTERVYVVECEVGLERRCYEIASSCSEYYLVGCNENIPKDGATDVIIEPDSYLRQAKLLQLSTDLAHELPQKKRLSVYTNNLAISQLEDVATVARQRLAFFGAFNILEKRQRSCPASIV